MNGSVIYSDRTEHGELQAVLFGLPDYSYINYEVTLAMRNRIFIPDSDAWLKNIFVTKEFRGRNGEGTRLLDNFLKICLLFHVKRIVGSFVNSPDSRLEDVQRWYEKKDFMIIEPVPYITFISKDI